MNLTRFSLFFPEKRDFFLEGRGIFDFGRGGGVAGAVSQPASATADHAVAVLQPAHRPQPRPRDPDRRRRPAHRQGRRVRRRRDEHPDRRRRRCRGRRRPTSRWCASSATSCGAAAIGAMFTNRIAVGRRAPGRNQALRRRRGVLVLPERRPRRLLRAHRDDRASTATTTATRASSTTAPTATARSAEYLKVGDNFNPEVGFVRRDDFTPRRSRSLRFSPRPTIDRVGAQVHLCRPTSSTSRTAPARSRRGIETGRFNTEFENSDSFNVEVDAQLRAAADAVRRRRRAWSIPAGGYHFNDVAGVATPSAQQRRCRATSALQAGEFYDGTITVARATARRASRS